MHEGSPLHEQGCLFCLGSDGGFQSREHILSEALNNHQKILEPGIVCDRCNNGPLAVLDNELIEFPPVSLMRAARGIPTKAGKAVISKWGNARVVYTGEGTLELLGPSRKAVAGMREFGGGKPGKLELVTGWPLSQARISRLTRAIWKAALEFVYFDRGPSVAYNATFDEVRRAILGAPSTGWVVLPTTSKPRLDSEVTYALRLTDQPSLSVVLNLFGVEFMTNVLARRRAPVAERLQFPAVVWTFDSRAGGAGVPA